MQFCKTIVNRWMFPCVFVVILCLSAPGSVHSSDFDGQWTGTWKSALGVGGATYGSLFLSGGAISGTLTNTNTDCGTVTLPVSGTLSNNIVMINGGYLLR